MELRSLKARSHDPISRILFLVTNNGRKAFKRSDFKVPFLSAPFICQEEYQIRIEYVLFLSVFSALRIRVSEGHLCCVYMIQFSEATKIGSLKPESVNGPQKSSP